MNAWSHLPNAHHIDRVLEAVKSHPEIWAAARDAAIVAAWDAARLAAWVATRGAARVAAWDAARLAAWVATRGAARVAARDASYDAAYDAAADADADGNAAADAAWDVAAALIAYDDSSKYLDMPSDQLRVWVILSEDPAAILLLPAVIAFENIAKKEKQLLTI